MIALSLALAALAPPPPPPPGRTELVSNFFKFAPTKLPAANLPAWARYISPNVQVFKGDKLIFATRAEWFEYLKSPRALGWKVGYSVAQLQFYELDDGGIRVLEWAYPFREGTVFDSVTPYRFVTYYFEGNQLVRVVYDQSMRLYDLKSGGPK